MPVFPRDGEATETLQGESRVESGLGRTVLARGGKDWNPGAPGCHGAARGSAGRLGSVAPWLEAEASVGAFALPTESMLNGVNHGLRCGNVVPTGTLSAHTTTPKRGAPSPATGSDLGKQLRRAEPWGTDEWPLNAFPCWGHDFSDGSGAQMSGREGLLTRAPLARKRLSPEVRHFPLPAVLTLLHPWTLPSFRAVFGSQRPGMSYPGPASWG